MSDSKSVTAPGRPTARELLVQAGGSDHALHSAVAREPAERGIVRLHCSCGSSFRVLAAESADALRNVPAVAS